MSLHRGGPWNWAAWSRGGLRGAVRRRRPVVEPLESRRLLATIAEYPTQTANSDPESIAVAPGGDLWFTEVMGNRIGTIDQTTHAIAEFALPAPDSFPIAITSGPHGNLWFTEFTGNRIGTIDPTTHGINEFAIPTASSGPRAIADGPDGHLWFTEFYGNRIGTIDPTTHVITEFALPTANSGPYAIAGGPDGHVWFTEYDGNKIGTIDPAGGAIAEFAIPTASSGPDAIAGGPDGNLWFIEESASKVGVLTPPLDLVVTAEPPALVAPGAPFGLTVSVFYQSGRPDTGYSGKVTLALATDPGGAALGGTLTVAAQDGVATFSGLTLDRVGGYRIKASTDPLTTALTTAMSVVPRAVVVPPTIVAERPILAGKGRRRVVGYQLDFSAALDPVRAMSVANYELTQVLRRGRKRVSQRVPFLAAYDAEAHRVTLTPAGRPKFTMGGRLVVLAGAPGGVADAAGVALDGGNGGAPGDDGTFVIATKGAAISR